MKSLLYVAQAHSYFPGRWANNFQVMKMCSAFSASGIDTTLLVPYNFLTKKKLKGIKPNLWDFYGVKTRFKIKWLRYYYPEIPLNKLIHGLVVTFFLCFNKPTVIYTRSEWVGLFVSLLLRRNIYLELHDFKKTAVQKLIIYLSSFNKHLFIITISDSLKSTIVSNGMIDKRLLVEHDGVDLSLYKFNQSKIEVFKKYNINKKMPVVLHLGSIGNGRGIENIFKVASKLKHVYFILIGVNYKELKKVYNNLLLDDLDNLKCLGFLPNIDVPALLMASDVLLMLYTSDLSTVKYTSPLKMFEYMASNVPIIASDFQVMKEILNNKNALLIPSSSPDDLKNAINKLLTNKKYARELARQAQEDVQYYEWKKRAIRIINFSIKNKSRKKES